MEASKDSESSAFSSQGRSLTRDYFVLCYESSSTENAINLWEDKTFLKQLGMFHNGTFSPGSILLITNYMQLLYDRAYYDKVLEVHHEISGHNEDVFNHDTLVMAAALKVGYS